MTRAENGWSRFDRAAGRVAQAGEAMTGRVFNIHDLPGGAVLIGTDKGLFIASARELAEAAVTCTYPPALAP